jgi:hypothetical protein
MKVMLKMPNVWGFKVSLHTFKWIQWDYLMENTHIEKVHLKQLILKGLSYNNSPKYTFKRTVWRNNISKRDSLKNTV